ncbi:LCP family protein [Aeromicrobium marinum]|nr:LCP family protein [Aeromicrobium marinum]
MPEPHPDDRYAWLYDDGRPARGTPSGDPSRRQPDLPPPNLPPPGGRPAAGPPSPPRRRRPVGRIVGLVLGAWLIFLVAVPVWAWSQIERVDAEPDGDRPAEQPGRTYLLVGTDSRAGLTEAEQVELATGPDEGGNGRTDTIMLMHVGSGPTVLLSIPRDSLVDIPGYDRTKINAAYAFGGPELLVQTVELNTGIRVDDYVEIGFGGLVKVVDSLGGVEICPETAIDDPLAGISLQAGCQEADGATALGYSRSRKTFATQDIQRVQSQREVIGSIAGEAKSPWTVLNPVRYVQVARAGTGSLAIGDNVGPISLARFAWSLSSAMGGGGLNCTVPLRDFAVNWDPERAPALFDLIASDRSADIGALCTPDGLPAA